MVKSSNPIRSIFKIITWRTGVSIPVPLECESSALPFELVPLVVQGQIETRCIDESNFGVSTEVLGNKYSLSFPVRHVRMAERSKAPDSRVELFLTGVFWSTNVGVGSNPTSDKVFTTPELTTYGHFWLL